MNVLRDLWRRGPLSRKLAELEPIDRATALIVLALAFSFVLSSSALFRHGVTG